MGAGCWRRCRVPLQYAAARCAWSCALWSLGEVPLQGAAATTRLYTLNDKTQRFDADPKILCYLGSMLEYNFFCCCFNTTSLGCATWVESLKNHGKRSQKYVSVSTCSSWRDHSDQLVKTPHPESGLTKVFGRFHTAATRVRSSGVCVCVCHTLSQRVLLRAGGWRGHVKLHPTKLLT